MSVKKNKESFWTSYSDLMTSLFFVMLVLFIICLSVVGTKNKALNDALRDANATKEQYAQILQLEEQFKTLSQSTTLQFDGSKKIFYVTKFVGVEIFMQDSDVIKNNYLEMVDVVGKDLEQILKGLSKNDKFSYQLVIEGTAAIPWNRLRDNSYNPDNKYAYDLSYRRALALYNRWRSKGVNLRKYNTEIIIAGSGFNGINRDEQVEENNKRFMVQIIPKIQKPAYSNDSAPKNH